MSGILKSKKFWMLLLSVIVIVSLIVLHWFIVLSLFVLAISLYAINTIIVNHCLSPIDELHPQRPIRKVDTLVIGDITSKRALATHVDLRNSLIITAPGRSAEASFLILKHVASRLDGNNVCIIAARNNAEKISAIDLPFFNSVTKLELGVKENPREIKYYMFYHLNIIGKSIRGLLSNPKEVMCNNHELEEYCQRKWYKLIYIQNN